MVRVAAFRIRAVLIRILIRIQGYVALNYGSGSLLFSSVDFKMPTKNNVFVKFFAYYLLKTQISIIFENWIRIRIRGLKIDPWTAVDAHEV
jgi:hypothetical protein